MESEFFSLARRLYYYTVCARPALRMDECPGSGGRSRNLGVLSVMRETVNA